MGGCACVVEYRSKSWASGRGLGQMCVWRRRGQVPWCRWRGSRVGWRSDGVMWERGCRAARLGVCEALPSWERRPMPMLGPDKVDGGAK